MKRYWLLLSLSLLTIGCSTTESNVSEKRTFYMGVTPWPADFTSAEIDSAYQFINHHCDIVSHHFDEGIPYEDAYITWLNWMAKNKI